MSTVSGLTIFTARQHSLL